MNGGVWIDSLESDDEDYTSASYTQRMSGSPAVSPTSVNVWDSLGDFRRHQPPQDRAVIQFSRRVQRAPQHTIRQTGSTTIGPVLGLIPEARINQELATYNLGKPLDGEWAGLVSMLSSPAVLAGRSVRVPQLKNVLRVLNTIISEAASVYISRNNLNTVSYPQARIQGRKTAMANSVAWLMSYLPTGSIPGTLPDGITTKFAHRRSIQRTAPTAHVVTRTPRPDPMMRGGKLLGSTPTNLLRVSKAGSGGGRVQVSLTYSRQLAEELLSGEHVPFIEPKPVDEDDEPFSDEEDTPAPPERTAGMAVYLAYDTEGAGWPWAAGAEGDTIQLAWRGQTYNVLTDEIRKAAKPTRPCYGDASIIRPRPIDITRAMLQIAPRIAATAQQGHPEMILLTISVAGRRPDGTPPESRLNTGVLAVYQGVTFSPYGLAHHINRVEQSVTSNPSLSENKEDDDDLEDLEQNFSLLDPLAFTRLEHPGRSVHCVHGQCFDMEVFLGFARDSRNFNCPICNRSALPSELRGDTFFLSLLRTTRESQADQVRVSTSTGCVLVEGDTPSTSLQSGASQSRPRLRFVSHTRDGEGTVSVGDTPNHTPAPDRTHTYARPTTVDIDVPGPPVRSHVGAGWGTEGDPFEID